MTKWNSPMQQFKRAQRRQRWDNPPELPKDHEAIPDLDLGMFTRRQADGSVSIFFEGTHLTSSCEYVVLGKYAEPKPDGSLYYVTVRKGLWGDKMNVRYFEHLLPAVAYIMELKERFDAGNS